MAPVPNAILPAAALVLVGSLALATWAQPAQVPLSVQGATEDDYDYSQCTLQTTLGVAEFQSNFLWGPVPIDIAAYDRCFNISGDVRLRSTQYTECYMARLGCKYTDERGNDNYTFSADWVSACEDTNYHELVFETCVDKSVTSGYVNTFLELSCTYANNPFERCELQGSICVEYNHSGFAAWLWAVIAVSAAVVIVGGVVAAVWLYHRRKMAPTLPGKEPLLAYTPFSYTEPTDTAVAAPAYYAAPSDATWVPTGLNSGPGDVAAPVFSPANVLEAPIVPIVAAAAVPPPGPPASPPPETSAPDGAIDAATE